MGRRSVPGASALANTVPSSACDIIVCMFLADN